MSLGALSSTTTDDISSSRDVTRPLPSFRDEEPLPAFPLDVELDTYTPPSQPVLRPNFLSNQYFNFLFDAAARKRHPHSNSELALLINDIVDRIPFDMLHPSLELIEDVLCNAGLDPKALVRGHKISDQHLNHILNNIHMALTEVMRLADDDEVPTNRVIPIERYPLPGEWTYEVFVDGPENDAKERGVEYSGVYPCSITSPAVAAQLSSAVTVVGQQVLPTAMIGMVPPPIRCA